MVVKDSKNKQKLAVIVVLYSQSYWEARRFVVELLQQLNKNDIVVVVSNNPLYKWLGRLEKLSTRVKTYVSPYNTGICAAINFGVKSALVYGADLLCFVNPDVSMSADALPKLREIVVRKHGIVSPVILLPDKNTVWYGGGWYSKLFGLSRNIFYLKDLSKINFTLKKTAVASGCCMMMPSSVWSKVGGYDERFFMYYDDPDLSLRALRKNVKIFVTNSTFLVHYKDSLNLNSLQAYYYARNPFLMVRKHTPIILRPFSWLCQFVIVLPRNILRLESVTALKWYLIGVAHGIVGYYGRNIHLS